MGKNLKKPAKKSAPAKELKPAKATKVAKAPKKDSAKQAKPSKPLMKNLVKAVQKVIGKDKAAGKGKAESKAHEEKVETTKSAAGAKTPAGKAFKIESPETGAKPSQPLKKDSKKPKKAKKSKEQELDLGDDLVGDDEMGAEEIPDLTEFEEVEVEESEELELEMSENDISGSRSSGDEEVVLTDAEGRRYCRVRDCDQISVVEGYCRFHYLLLWKRIQVRRKILTDGKLQRYVEDLTARYPDKFLEMIRKDLRTEKDFLAAIAELEIDESAIDNEFEDEAQNFIDEVRGMSEGTSMSDEQEEF